MKSCPQCESVDVPDKAERCPFCGYVFTESVKEEMMNVSTGLFFDKSEDLFLEPESLDEVPENQLVQKQEKALESEKKCSQSTVVRKKKHGLRNFLIAVGIVCVVYCVFMDDTPDSENVNGFENTGMSTDEQSQVINDEVNVEMSVDERAVLLSQIKFADQYVLPLSDVIYLERSDLEGLTAEQLRIARNELYARYGRMFQDEGLQAHFNNCQWYVGTILAEDFSEEIFNEYEIANRDLIKAYEHELGINGQ